jgi:ribosome-binding factor A
MADFNRTRRIGELIQREIAQMLQREIKDPRVKNVSISAVKVNRDLSIAKVFYTLFDTLGGKGSSDENSTDEDVAKEKRLELLAKAKEGLDKASGFIRHSLGKKIQLRKVPKLDFRYDESILRGANMSQLIDQVIANDVKTHIEVDLD